MPHLVWIGLLAVALSAQAAEVGNISASESRSLETRVNSRNYTFLGFGPGLLSNTGSEGTAYHLTGGWSREVHPNASIRILGETDFQPGSGAGMAHAGVGAMGFFTRTDIAPYLGADFGYGFSWGTPDKAAQFAWGLSAGVQLFRTSTTQLGVEGRVYSILDRTSEGIPVATSLQLGVYF